MRGLRSFRTYSAHEPALRVAHDLAAHATEFVVFRREEAGSPLWYRYQVDEELLKKLRRAGKVLEALRLPERPAVAPRYIGRGTFSDLLGVPRAANGPDILVDGSGAVRGVETREGGPAGHQLLYTRVDTDDGLEVESDQVVEYTVALEASARAGTSTALAIQFPDGKQEITLHATVSSTEFQPVQGEPWSKQFTVDRELRVQPPYWTFKARAVGALPQYSLLVSFVAEGSPAGAVRVTARRRGLPVAAGAAPVSTTGFVGLPSRAGARAVMTVAEQPNQSYGISIVQDGQLVCRDQPFKASQESFRRLQDGEIDDLGLSLWADLPIAVRAFLDDPAHAGEPLLIQSNGRVAPFEVLQLRPGEDGPRLGIDRPVARWEEQVQPGPGGVLAATRAACLRSLDWPDLESQEAGLRVRVPGLLPVDSVARLNELLDMDEVALLHFAGHASDSPAQLKIGNDVVSAGAFRPSSALLKKARPFLFLNGCRAANAQPSASTVFGNLAKSLLLFGFRGLVAPVVEIESAASTPAAHAFYEAASGGATVAEALQSVRQLAAAAPPDHRATYLAYVAIAPVDLRLAFPPGP